MFFFKYGHICSTRWDVFHNVYIHSGYRIRSRRARIWDPGSTLFAEDADRRPSSTARSSAMRRTVACAPQISSQGAVDGVASRLREDPLDADPPVDMDWKQVILNDCFTALDGTMIIAISQSPWQSFLRHGLYFISPCLGSRNSWIPRRENTLQLLNFTQRFSPSP